MALHTAYKHGFDAALKTFKVGMNLNTSPAGMPRTTSAMPQTKPQGQAPATGTGTPMSGGLSTNPIAPTQTPQMARARVL